MMGYQTASLVVLWLALALSSAFNMKSGRIRNHGHYVCSTWGNDHFKTFDGDFYQFPGRCSYNLASDCQDSYRDFSVHVQRTVSSGHPLIDKVIIAVKDVIIQLTSNLVVVNGAIAKTPYYSFGILIQKNDAYFKVYTKTGLTLMWNKEDAVMVELDPKYNNRTCGLCGDYNGVPVYNEFLSGDILLSPVQFGNLQNIHDPNDECNDPDETQKIDTSQCSQYRSVCEEHLTHSAFSDCQNLLNVEAYINACMLDMCSCGQSQDSFCLCSTISEFSRQCSHAGGRPGNWRTDSFCPKTCPANMIYQESGSPCKNSCSHQEIHSLCEEHYMDGCFCPEGTVQDDYTNKGCVAVSECHCKHRDTLHAPGQTVRHDCDECRCDSGRWNCTDHVCPGVCSIEGGAHLTTFDGKAYTFHGNCYYVLSKGHKNESHVILGEMTPCSSSERETCLKSVILLTDNLKNVVTFKADGTVLLNEQTITLPHVTASFSILKPSDSYVIVQATFGLQMQIQRLPIMQLYITMEKSARRKLQGLCGNFNSKEADDFKTSSGLVEATASAFGNTWKAQPNCHDVSEFLDDPCSLSIENKNYADYWCSLLEKEESPFSKCHLTIDPTSYAKRCRYDSCSCKNSEHCMCAAFSSYVRACAAKGIILWGWRKGICDKDVASCPSTQIYLYNLTTCQPTCRSLAEGEKACTSVFTPIDGCGCPDQEYLNETSQCVPISKCSCYYHGTYLNPLEVIYKQDERCSCHNGKLLCTSHVNDTCPKGKLYYDCNKQPHGAGPPSHRSCKTLGVEYFQTECISGCVCPHGLLDDGAGGCVPEERCPCVHNDDIYPHGTRVNVDCNTCVCQRGQWTCTNAVCYGTCTIYGSGHYITFDEKLYDFDGNCEFVAAQDYCGPHHSDGNFSIIIENIPCGTTGVTCSKSINVFLGSKVLKLADKNLEVTEGQGEKHVSYYTREVGIYLAIETSNGILLIWDRKTTMFIKVSPVYKGKLCGLCGNFDDNSQNDFKTSHMLQVTNVLEFGNSWKVDPSCPDAIDVTDPCTQNPHRHSWAEKQCGLIKSKVFKVCHSKVDPMPFYEACVNDACSCDSGGDCECFCTAVAAYAQECTKAGACVHWRTPDICPIFCDYYNPKDECEWHYHPCGKGSIQTCRSINNIYTNVTITYLEGCYPTCPEDRPIFDESKRICVTREQCGCYINKTHYEIGEEVPSNEICKKCECSPQATVDCYPVDDEIISREEHDGVCIVRRCENGTLQVDIEICSTAVPSTTSVTSTTFSTTSTTTVTTTPPTSTTSPSSTTCVFEKVCEWTQWFDVSEPTDDPDSGDFETYDEIRKHHEFCNVPEQIQCRAVKAPDVSLEELKQTVHCNVSFGLICQNSEQKLDNNLWPKCYDYEIRVDCCEWRCVHSTTPTTTTTTIPTTTTPTTTTTTPSTTTTTETYTTTTTTPTTTTATTITTVIYDDFCTLFPELCKSTTFPTTTETTTTSTNPTSTMSSTPPSTTTPSPPSPTTTSVTTTPPPIITTTECTTETEETTPLWTTTTETTPGTTTTTSTTTTTTSCVPVCSWSQWFDVSYPEYKPDGGDYETYDNIRAEGFDVCERPENISCRAQKFPHISLEELGQKVTCDVSTGLICNNKDQTGFMPVCYNYETSVYCCSPLPDYCTTTQPTTTKPTTTINTEYTTTIKTTTTTPPTPSTPCEPVCSWSQWFDVSYPEYKPDGGDYETYDNIRAEGFEVCDRPENISCRAQRFPDMPLEGLGQKVTCDISTGLICYNKDQTGFMPVCYNYEISVYCCSPPDHCTTTQPTTTKPNITTTPTISTTSPTTTKPPTASTTTPPTPGTTTTTLITTTGSTTSCVPVCSWSPWFDVSYPEYKPDGGDYETYDNIRAEGFDVCERPENISCRAQKFPHISLEELGQKVTCDVSTGLICNNKDQTGFMPVCYNYETSVYCCSPLPDYCITTQPTTTKPTTTTKTTTTTPPTPSTPCEPVCSWSQWFDVTYPEYKPDGGDYETYDNIRSEGFEVCDRPENISCRAQKFPDIPLEELGQKVTCDVSTGLICYNKDQTGFMPVCYNYEISVYCCSPPDYCTTTQPTTTKPTNITTEHTTALKTTTTTPPTPEPTSSSTSTQPTTTSPTSPPTGTPTEPTTTSATTSTTTTRTTTTTTTSPPTEPTTTSVSTPPTTTTSPPTGTPTESTTSVSTPPTTTSTTTTTSPPTGTPTEPTTTSATTSPTTTRTTTTTTTSPPTEPTTTSPTTTTSPPTGTPTESTTTSVSTPPTTTSTTTITSPPTGTPTEPTTTSATTSPTTISTTTTTTTSPPTEPTTTSPTTTTSPPTGTPTEPTTTSATTSPTTISTTTTTTTSPPTEPTTTSPTTTTSPPTGTPPEYTTSVSTPPTTTSTTTTTSPPTGTPTEPTTTSATTSPTTISTTTTTTTSPPTEPTTTSPTTTTSPPTGTPTEPTTSVSTPPTTTSTKTTTSPPTGTPTEPTTTSATTSPTTISTTTTTTTSPPTEPTTTSPTTTTSPPTGTPTEPTPPTTTSTTTTTSPPTTTLPTPGTTTATPITTTGSTTSCVPVCSWSPWFDVSYPEYKPDGGDYETYDNIRAEGFEVCEKPENISCRAQKFPHISLEALGQKVTCDVSTGLICNNKDQTGFMPVCYNYETSVYCCSPLPDYCTTTQPTTTKPTTTITTEYTTTIKTTTTTPPTPSTPCEPVCSWSQWFDVTYPEYKPDGGDYETYDNIRAEGFEVCDRPENISCRAQKFPDIPLEELGQKVTCDVSTGLICYNKDQTGFMPVCYNYEISVYCCSPPDYCTTTQPTTTKPTTTLKTTTTTPPTPEPTSTSTSTQPTTTSPTTSTTTTTSPPTGTPTEPTTSATTSPTTISTTTTTTISPPTEPTTTSPTTTTSPPTGTPTEPTTTSVSTPPTTTSTTTITSPPTGTPTEPTTTSVSTPPTTTSTTTITSPPTGTPTEPTTASATTSPTTISTTTTTTPSPPTEPTTTSPTTTTFPPTGTPTEPTTTSVSTLPTTTSTTTTTSPPTGTPTEPTTTSATTPPTTISTTTTTTTSPPTEHTTTSPTTTTSPPTGTPTEPTTSVSTPPTTTSTTTITSPPTGTPTEPTTTSATTSPTTVSTTSTTTTSPPTEPTTTSPTTTTSPPTGTPTEPTTSVSTPPTTTSTTTITSPPTGTPTEPTTTSATTSPTTVSTTSTTTTSPPTEPTTTSPTTTTSPPTGTPTESTTSVSTPPTTTSATTTSSPPTGTPTESTTSPKTPSTTTTTTTTFPPTGTPTEPTTTSATTSPTTISTTTTTTTSPPTEPTTTSPTTTTSPPTGTPTEPTTTSVSTPPTTTSTTTITSPPTGTPTEPTTTSATTSSTTISTTTTTTPSPPTEPTTTSPTTTTFPPTGTPTEPTTTSVSTLPTTTSTTTITSPPTGTPTEPTTTSATTPPTTISTTTTTTTSPPTEPTTTSPTTTTSPPTGTPTEPTTSVSTPPTTTSSTTITSPPTGTPTEPTTTSVTTSPTTVSTTSTTTTSPPTEPTTTSHTTTTSPPTGTPTESTTSVSTPPTTTSATTTSSPSTGTPTESTTSPKTPSTTTTTTTTFPPTGTPTEPTTTSATTSPKTPSTTTTTTTTSVPPTTTTTSPPTGTPTEPTTTSPTTIRTTTTTSTSPPTESTTTSPTTTTSPPTSTPTESTTSVSTPPTTTSTTTTTSPPTATTPGTPEPTTTTGTRSPTTSQSSTTSRTTTATTYTTPLSGNVTIFTFKPTPPSKEPQDHSTTTEKTTKPTLPPTITNCTTEEPPDTTPIPTESTTEETVPSTKPTTLTTITTSSTTRPTVPTTSETMTTYSITTTSEAPTPSETTTGSTTQCVCVYNGMPFPPGEIISGVANSTWCYQVDCSLQCTVEVHYWICVTSTTVPTTTPVTTTTESTTTTPPGTTTTPGTTTSQSTPTATPPGTTTSGSTPTPEFTTSTPTPEFTTTPESTTTVTSEIPTTTPGTTTSGSTPTPEIITTTSGSTPTPEIITTTSGSTPTPEIITTTSGSTPTPEFTTTPESTTPVTPEIPTTTPGTTTESTTTPKSTTPSTTTSTTKPSNLTTTSTVSTTPKLPGCPFEPHREHNETWILCNCTMARCLENNTVEIIELKCEPPPEIKCANGRPPRPVPDEDLCCWHWECDCVCTGWGDPHYVTFDGTYYSYQGNCTYTLVEEIEKTIDNFGIYIDNYDCGARDRVSCPRDIIVRHESQIIRIKTTRFVPLSLEVEVNGEVVGTPYKKYGVKVYTSGINYVVEIPELGANITFNGLAFSIKLPFGLFGHNTQGQCGTCTNNKADDCLTRSGEIVSSCEVMADSWVVSDPRKPTCGGLIPTVPPKVTAPSPPCQPSPLCELILGVEFQKCHKKLQPKHFYEACVFDSCHVPNSNIECTSLQQYALLCADQGVCVEWRHKASKCPMTCPSHKVYNACGPALPRTCQTIPEEQIKDDNRLVEGCFCPTGTTPFSDAIDVCVSTCGCVGPDNVPREFGEEFQFDCQDCICREGGSGITCHEHKCPKLIEVDCDLEGSYPEIQPISDDACCSETVCKCDTSQCSTRSPHCQLGYEAVGEIPEGHCCPVYTCVRKKVCVHGNAEYLPGAPVFSDHCQSCECSENANATYGVEIKCTHVACDVRCPQGFELKQTTSDCCGVCEQTHCVVTDGKSYHLLKPGESMASENSNCTLYSCTVIRKQFISSVSTISCPYFNEDECEPGTIQYLPNGCCKICIERTTSCKLQESYDYLSHNNCRSKDVIKMSRCDGSCNTFSIYSAAARSMSHKCTCCQEVQTSKKQVTLQCSDGSELQHEYIDVEQCECVNTECGPAQPTEGYTPARARRALRKSRSGIL